MGDKLARLLLHINTEAIAGDEYIMVAFLCPIDNAWHPCVQEHKYNSWITVRAARLIHAGVKMMDEDHFRSRLIRSAPDIVPDPRVPDPG